MFGLIGETTQVTYVYESSEAEVDTPQAAADPMTVKLVGAAQEVYTHYYQAHGENAVVPLGVVVDRKTLRGHLIFTGQPILLPQETFIPIEQISYSSSDTEEYWE